MNWQKLIIAVGTLLLTATPVVAATPAPTVNPFGSRAPQIDLNNSYQPPKLYVADAKISSQTDAHVTGAFTLQNQEAYITNAQYRFELIGPIPAATRQQYSLPDNATILYSRSVATQVVGLTPGENRAISFTFSWPNVPTGNYTLKIQLLTSTGRSLGWGELAVTKSTPDPLFTYLYPGSLQIAEYKEFQQPLTGPNISPNENFLINATAQNLSAQTQHITPQLTVYAFDPDRQGQTPQILTFPTLTLPAGKSFALSLPVKSAAKPQVYFAQLKLLATDKAVHSTVAEYRWVVRGVGADIIIATPLRYDANSKQLTIQITYAGAADAETKFTGAIHVDISDTQGSLGSQTIPNIQFTDALGGGFATIPLTRSPLQTFTVTTSITDDKQATIYTQAQTFPAASLPSIAGKLNILNINTILTSIGLIAIAVLTITVIKKRQNKGKK